MPARRKRKAKKTSYSPFGTPSKQKKGGQARKQQEARQKSQVPERSPAQWEKEKQQRVAERRAIQNVAGKWCGHLKIRLLHTEVKQLKGAHDAFWIANRRPLTPLSCCVAIIESPVLFVIEFHFSSVRSGATLEHWRRANFSSEFLLKHVPEASCVIAGPHPDAPTDLKQKKKIRVPALEFLTAIPQPVSCTAPDLLDFFDERLRRAARRGEVRGLRSRGVSFPADDEREWRMAVRVSYSTDNQVHWHTELCVVATDDES